MQFATADLNIGEMFDSLESIESDHPQGEALKEKFLKIVEERIKERRNEMSDVLMFLFGSKVKGGKRFYKTPDAVKIAEYIDFFGISTISESNYLILSVFFNH